MNIEEMYDKELVEESNKLANDIFNCFNDKKLTVVTAALLAVISKILSTQPISNIPDKEDWDYKCQIFRTGIQKVLEIADAEHPEEYPKRH
jgi:hypothetical protein